MAITMAGKRPTTIAEYIRAAPRAGQPHLRRLHALLKSVAPDAEEAIKWGTPFFVEPRFLFAFSAHKAHCSFAPAAAALAQFREELKAHSTTKGTLDSLRRAPARGLDSPARRVQSSPRAGTQGRRVLVVRGPMHAARSRGTRPVFVHPDPLRAAIPMPILLRNALAVIAGIAIGGSVNMAIITLGSSLIPAPAGVDVRSAESLGKSMHLFEARHFVMPFLAHALGTLAGALAAYLIAATWRAPIAYAIGVVFLCGGIAASFMIPAPAWFIALDLLVAYVPMAWLGVCIGKRLARGTAGVPDRAA